MTEINMVNVLYEKHVTTLINVIHVTNMTTVTNMINAVLVVVGFVYVVG